MWKWQNIKTGRRFSKINVYSSIFEKEVTRGNLGIFALALGKQKINKYQNASSHGHSFDYPEGRKEKSMI